MLLVGRRRRVSLRESFKIATEAWTESDVSGSGASMIATIAFGIWWWIVGVPINRDRKRDGYD